MEKDLKKWKVLQDDGSVLWCMFLCVDWWLCYVIRVDGMGKKLVGRKGCIRSVIVLAFM